MITDYGNVTICGPGEVETVRTDPLGVKWCFVCRKRVEFTQYVKRAADWRNDYYGPWAEISCENDHQDGDLFPGWAREWVE